MIHSLKIWPEYFAAVKDGIKPFEIRKIDRHFQVGDTLHLREFAPTDIERTGRTGEYTGRECRRVVTYVHSGLGLAPGYVALGIAKEARP